MVFRRYIGVDPHYWLHVSDRLLTQRASPILDALEQLNGGTIHLPERDKDRPNQDAIAALIDAAIAVWPFQRPA
jgi:hypothetical protein